VQQQPVRISAELIFGVQLSEEHTFAAPTLIAQTFAGPI
jgi:hypothetical protein